MKLILNFDVRRSLARRGFFLNKHKAWKSIKPGLRLDYKPILVGTELGLVRLQEKCGLITDVLLILQRLLY